MAERASDQEIIRSVTAIHGSIIEAWGHDETQYTSWVESSVSRLWTMDVRDGCQLTVKDECLRSTGANTTPLESYAVKDKGYPGRVELTLALPGGRRGDFLLRGLSSEVSVEDKSPDNPETLSCLGLLRLLGVSTPQDVWSYITKRTTGEDVRKKVERHVVFAPPNYSYWPSLVARDTTTEGVRTSLTVGATYAYEPNPVTGDFPRTSLAGSVDLSSGKPELQEFEFTDTWIDPYFLPSIYQDYPFDAYKGVSQCRIEWNKIGLHMLAHPEVAKQRLERNILTPSKLVELERMTLDGLNLFFGLCCQRYDMRTQVGGHDRMRDKNDIVGLDGSPNELATQGYEFAYHTRPVGFK